MNSEHRSRNTILSIVERIENGEILSIDEAKGITGRSVLLDVPDFNFTYDVPAEYLHCGCLGVTKRLIELTFNVGKKYPRVTTRKLSNPKQFDKLMLGTKVTKEFPRRARRLDLSVFKGQEYRNIALYFWPFVLECIEPAAKERHLWLYWAFMMRSATVPSNEFAPLSIPLINQTCSLFYNLYEETLGIQNCVYNLHTFCSHLLEIRTHGPLTETSAFKFESFYGEMRRAFVPGTPSTLKQILKNICLKRALGHHVCENTISITNYNTSLECNNLIYCYTANEYSIYQVEDIQEDIMLCHKVGQYPANFPETPDLPWSSIGVFRKGGVSSTIVKIKASDVYGKVLNVGKYLITCPINVLNEK